MKKLITIILLFIITTVTYGQVFKTTLTQVDLYDGYNFDTFVSSQTISSNFTLDNYNNKISITHSSTDMIVFDITNMRRADYQGHDFLVMEIRNINNNTTGKVIVIDKPIKTNTMQILFNFDDNKSLIFDTDLKLD